GEGGRQERQRVHDPEASVLAVPVRRVDQQAVLRRHPLEDRLRRRRSGRARKHRETGAVTRNVGSARPQPSGAARLKSRSFCLRYRATAFPATYTALIFFTFEMSASGSPSSATKSA